MRYEELPTPCYIIDEQKLRANGEILSGVAERTGCHILLAQKAFSAFAEYPLVAEYLDGTTASSLYEARLSKEEFGKENHIFAPAYREEEFDEIAGLCDHIVFNSFSQYARYRDRLKGKSAGIRVNPECPTQDGHEIYDPCRPGSRMGMTLEEFEKHTDLLSGIEGIHFHTLCEQNADDLQTTLRSVEEKFGKYLKGMKWVNFGGGHHITRPGYHISLLEECILLIQESYDVEVYLEPGEAVALNAGYLLSQVMDHVHNGRVENLILDASAACHMPDVLEMPYRPPVKGAALPGEKPYTYRLGGNTCLAGDIIGDYSFDHPLQIGERVLFEDMAIYSMVKNNTFNGIGLPAIAVLHQGEGTDRYQLIREFGYEDFKGRLS
ncbi:MAG: carboxynorspermidine decarboxylase [Lachnospiraceae bacterium]|nr:carboxynorspermidine decarboxylase [Lachnospiraceae bacterium]